MKNLITMMALGLLTTSVGCDGGDTDPTGTVDGSDATVIVVLPLTGDFAPKGKKHENAVVFGLEHLLGGGFVEATGREFNLVRISSGDKTLVPGLLEDAIAETENDDGDINVSGIITSTGGAHQGSAPIALSEGIPLFEASSGAHDPEFISPEVYSEDQLKYLFATRAMCNYEAIMTAEAINEIDPTGTVALFRGNKTHDKMHTEVIRTALTEDIEFAGTLLATDSEEEQWDYVLDYEATSFAPAIQEVMDANSALSTVFFHLRGDGPNKDFLTDLNQVGFTGTIITCGMAKSNELIDNDLNGGMSEYLKDRLYFVMRGPIPSAELDLFKSEYETKFSDTPDTHTASVYDAMMLLGTGIAAAADSSDNVQVRDAIIASSSGGTAFKYGETAELITAASAGDDIDYNGPSGSLDYRPEDRTVPGSFWVVLVEADDAGGYKYTELTTPARVTK